MEIIEKKEIIHFSDNDSDSEIQKCIKEIKDKINSTISFPTPENKIKRISHKHTHMFNYDGFNLDITYITDKIIAMSFPKDNVRDELNQFFLLRHKNKVKVYNLCSEFTYEKGTFPHQAHYPFNDHEVPSFCTLLEFCKDLNSWLNEDKENVAAIHCKAGLGRTGLIISSYLIYSNFINHWKKAIQFFRIMRTQHGRALKNPSQQRYLKYFYKSVRKTKYNLENLSMINCKTFIVEKIKIGRFSEKLISEYSEGKLSLAMKFFSNSQSCLPNEDDVKFLSNQNDSQDDKSCIYDIQLDEEGNCIHELDVPIQGDVKFYLLNLTKEKAKSNIICYFFINTLFLKYDDKNKNIFKLTKSDIDGAFKDHDLHTFDSDFNIELELALK
jgi:protein-tyrosine phosphatase